MTRTDNVHALSLTSHLPLSSLARCSALFPHPAAPGSLSRAAYPGPACMLFRAAYHTAARMLFQVPGYQEPDAAGGAHDGAHHVFDARCPSGGLSSRAGLRSDAVGVSTPKRRRSPSFDAPMSYRRRHMAASCPARPLRCPHTPVCPAYLPCMDCASTRVARISACRQRGGLVSPPQTPWLPDRRGWCADSVNNSVCKGTYSYMCAGSAVTTAAAEFNNVQHA